MVETIALSERTGDRTGLRLRPLAQRTPGRPVLLQVRGGLPDSGAGVFLAALDQDRRLSADAVEPLGRLLLRKNGVTKLG